MTLRSLMASGCQWPNIISFLPMKDEKKCKFLATPLENVRFSIFNMMTCHNISEILPG